jgi:flagella basal body P-ring formation protein FlgA
MEMAEVVGKMATMDISENSVITSNLLKEKTVIFRGNQVTIKLINGELTLTGVGQALQDGYIGQNIQIKVLGFRASRIVLGKVLDVDLVEINLGGK